MEEKIKNCMEDLVFETIDNTVDSDKQCLCEKCRLDIAAKALNLLSPCYVVSDKGELYTKSNMLRAQFEVDIIQAVSKAAMIVGNNPRHQ